VRLAPPGPPSYEAGLVDTHEEQMLGSAGLQLRPSPLKRPIDWGVLVKGLVSKKFSLAGLALEADVCSSEEQPAVARSAPDEHADKPRDNNAILRLFF